MSAFAAVLTQSTGTLSVRVAGQTSDSDGNRLRINIYQVAKVSGDRYEKSSSFSECSFDVNRIGELTAAENRNNAAQLAAFVSAKDVAHTMTKTINKEGVAKFNGVELGVYLVMEANGSDEHFTPFLITVPQVENGGYIYDVDASPKMEHTTEPTVPGGSTEPTVPSGSTEPTVPGGSTEPTVPGGSTEPTVPEDSTKPTVPDNTTETTVPEGTTEPSEETTSRTTTDTTKPGNETTTEKTDKPELPLTGQLWWPVYLMAVSGMLIFGYGCLKKRGSADE